jgi:aryl-alcohol dehydrogenase-like predicted oxidoreductase
MDYVNLVSGAPASSRLGFGCGSVMGRIGRAQSLRAIAAALDAGITHFDVARLYGYGEAEALVGEALRGRRDRVVIASKFGLEAPRSAGALRALKPAAQFLAGAIPGARAVLRSLVGGPSEAADRFSPAKAAASLDQSLAALKSDYLDILFLHDCAAEDLSDELLAFLDGCVAAGKIRAYGVATEIEAATPLAALHRNRLIYQFANSRFAPNAERLSPAGLRIVAHSPFYGAERLGEGDAHRAMLAHALAATEVGVVLCSMLGETHLRANLAVAEGARAAYAAE